MIKGIFRLLNNERSIYYIIIFYLIVALLFSLSYFVMPFLFEGSHSLRHTASSQAVQFVDNFFDCLYFSITSQTTVGYGDIVPATLLGKIISSVQMIFGYFYLAFIIAFFTTQAILKSDKFKALLLQNIEEKSVH